MSTENKPTIRFDFDPINLVSQAVIPSGHPLARDIVRTQLDKAQRLGSSKLNIFALNAQGIGLEKKNEELNTEEYQSVESKDELVSRIFDHTQSNGNIYIVDSYRFGTLSNKEQITYIKIKNPVWDEAAELVKFAKDNSDVLIECIKRDKETNDIISTSVFSPATVKEDEFKKEFEQLMHDAVGRVDPFEDNSDHQLIEVYVRRNSRPS